MLKRLLVTLAALLATAAHAGVTPTIQLGQYPLARSDAPDQVLSTHADVKGCADSAVALSTVPGAYRYTCGPHTVDVLNDDPPPPPAASPKVAALYYGASLSAERIKLLARYPLVILGPAGSKANAEAIRALNPQTQICRYVKMSEWPRSTSASSAKHAIRLEIDRNDWWLRAGSAYTQQYMPGSGEYDVNPTPATRPNARGERWPQYKARTDIPTLEGHDCAFVDNAMASTRVAADWHRNGSVLPKGSAAANAAQRAGVASYIDALAPHVKTFACNVESKEPRSLVQPEYAGKCAWAFLEGMTGASYSPDTWGTLATVLDRYRQALADLGTDRVLMNFQGATLQAQLYGLGIGLLGDGYSLVTDGYDQPPPWIPEMAAPIGTPVSAAVCTGTLCRREYSHGLVLVNGHKTAPATTQAAGYRRLDGTDAGTVTLPPRSAAVLIKG